MLSYAKIEFQARYGSFLLDQMNAHLDLVLVYLSDKYNWEKEVYWCKFEKTVEVFVSTPPVHFYVICYMELLNV